MGPKSITIPAPSGGIDTSSPVGQMDPLNCMYAYNMGPSETGISTRPGYREYVLDVENTSALGVTTLIPYDGPAGSRLYAVTNEGIWDVSTYNTTPVQKYTFTTDTTASAGWGVYIAYVDQANKEWLFYADSTNGLFECDVSANTWATYAGITGVSAADIGFITSHKRRIWLVERGTSTAWYLPVDAKTGAATEFFFGTKFLRGGSLVGLWNWTVDGGTGVDDYLVALSSSGDVLPYKGPDPSDASWGVAGMYYIGQIPEGRRIATEYAGDLHLLSSRGLIAMSDLLKGVSLSDTKQSVSRKVAKLLRREMSVLREDRGWNVALLPAIDTLLIVRPTRSGHPELQYSSSLTLGGWGNWRGIGIRGICEWKGKVYIGTDDNKVWVMDADRDAMEISPSDPSLNGQPIDFSILYSFQRIANDGRVRQVTMIRPDFYSVNAPLFETKAIYDYKVSELVAISGDQGQTDDVWDTGTWDSAVWAGSVSVGHSGVLGSCGMGRSVATAIRGKAVGETVLLSVDLLYREGHQL